MACSPTDSEYPFPLDEESADSFSDGDSPDDGPEHGDRHQAFALRLPDDPLAAQAGHLPVLPSQVIHYLDPQPGQVILDATLGRAGHGWLITQRLGSTGRYIGLDVDDANLAFAKKRLADAPCRCDFIKSNFASAPTALNALGVDRVDGLLADLGFASTQMDDPARGFSFLHDGPLDMRLDPSGPVTAADLVNQLSAEELADIIYQYGEERLSRKIARFIVEKRQRQPIQTTEDLAWIVREAFGVRRPTKSDQAMAEAASDGGSKKNRGNFRGKRGGRGGRGGTFRGGGDPATRTFMALRIAVNGELDSLGSLLSWVPNRMNPSGRVVVISFHSLEDRPVKQTFVRWVQQELAERLTKKPAIAQEDELAINPRSRSAKLRAIRWLGSVAEGR